MEKKIEPRRSSWFPVFREDMKIINQHFSSTGEAPTVRALYESVCSIANERQTLSFVESLALIAHTAGVSWRTAQRHIRELERLNLVKVEEQPGPRASLKYTLTRREVVSSCDTVSQRYDVDEALPCRTSSTKENNKTIPPPPQPHGFSVFVSRFRSIGRAEFQSTLFDDQSIVAILHGYELPVIEAALADLERDAPGEVKSINPLKKLGSYLRTAKAQSEAPQRIARRKPAAKHSGIQEQIKPKVVAI